MIRTLVVLWVVVAAVSAGCLAVEMVKQRTAAIERLAAEV